MINRLKLIILILVFAPMALFSGCLPGKKIETIVHEPEVLRPPVMPAEIINDLDKRISVLEDILKNADTEEKRKVCQGLLNDFRKIRASIQPDMTDKDYQKVIRILIQGMGRFDEAYFLKRGPSKEQLFSQAILDFNTRRRKIQDSYMSGDYKRVIAQCVELEAAFGPDSLTPDVGLLFAVSLAKNNMAEEALNIGMRIAQEMEGRPDLINLRADMIEWQLDMGNREKAMEIYEKLVDNLDEREAILKKARLAVNKKEGGIALPEIMQGTAGEASEGTGQDKKARTEEILKEVDGLVEKGKFTEARLLLIRWRLRVEEGPELETIDQALKSVELAEERHNEKLSHEKEGMEAANRLIEEENYEEAIKKLDSVEGQDKNPEAKRIRDLAIENIINRDRYRAAQIFLMAKRSDDPKKKEELLLSSHKILEQLIDKYPDSSLIDKLKDNLKKVEEELEKLKTQS